MFSPFITLAFLYYFVFSIFHLCCTITDSSCFIHPITIFIRFVYSIAFSLLRVYSLCFLHLLLHTLNILIKSNRTCCILFTYLQFYRPDVLFSSPISGETSDTRYRMFSFCKTVFVFSIANLNRYTVIIHRTGVMREQNFYRI